MPGDRTFLEGLLLPLLLDPSIEVLLSQLVVKKLLVSVLICLLDRDWLVRNYLPLLLLLVGRVSRMSLDRERLFNT